MGNFAENLNLGNRFRPPPLGLYFQGLFFLGSRTDILCAEVRGVIELRNPLNNNPEPAFGFLRASGRDYVNLS